MHTRSVLASLLLSCALAAPIHSQQTPCSIQPYGASCGATLSGTARPVLGQRAVVVEVRGAPAQAPGLLVLGLRPASQPIPGTLCTLLASPDFVLPFVTDAKGSAQLGAAFSYQVPLALGFAQGLYVGAGKLGATNGLMLGPFVASDTLLSEDFSVTRMRDALRSGARWGGGQLVPGVLGGSGALGDFHASDGRDSGLFDAAGRKIWIFDTDSQKIPAKRTLNGKDVTVTTGVFEFLSIVVASKERVRFVGSKPLRLRAAGRVDIQGVLELYVPAVPKSAKPKSHGALGGKGGPGGAPGGKGGDVLAVVGGSIHGAAGGALKVSPKHPNAAKAVGSGGGGSLAHPRSGRAANVVWIINTGFSVYSRQIAAGGAGGSYWQPPVGVFGGFAGRALPTVARPPFWPYAAGGVEFGPPSVPGKPFPVWLATPPAAVPSTELYLIGGSGGGGGGLHPLYSTTGTVTWSAGAGGAGGGGVLSLRSGGDLQLGQGGAIEARGGSARDIVKDVGSSGLFQPPTPAAGGGGSGGSVLLQTGGVAKLAGLVDVRGGKGGSFSERRTISPLLYIESLGGDGGPGYARVEALTVPDWRKLTGFKPAASSQNTGQLRVVDFALSSVAVSGWYRGATAGITPVWGSYVIRAKLNGKSVVFSDDPVRHPGSVQARTGQAVALFVQSARLDPVSGAALGEPTPWAEGALAPLNGFGASGEGLRFLLRLDKSMLAVPATIVVESISFRLRC